MICLMSLGYENGIGAYHVYRAEEGHVTGHGNGVGGSHLVVLHSWWE